MHYVVIGAGILFQIWMTIDAVRQRQWIWIAAIWLFPGGGGLWYFLNVYRHSALPAFEWPGSTRRKRIKELQGKIHHLDNAHHHAELGSIYLEQGRPELAEDCYRAALARDSEDLDIRAAMGKCQYAREFYDEASRVLAPVCAEDPCHDYAQTMMILGESYAELGEHEKAVVALRKVMETNSYPRARVKLAEQFLKLNRRDEARSLCKELVAEAMTVPKFAEKRDRQWYARADRLLRSL
jgi:hypothetical protein